MARTPIFLFFFCLKSDNQAPHLSQWRAYLRWRKKPAVLQSRQMTVKAIPLLLSWVPLHISLSRRQLAGKINSSLDFFLSLLHLFFLSSLLSLASFFLLSFFAFSLFLSFLLCSLLSFFLNWWQLGCISVPKFIHYMQFWVCFLLKSHK